MTHMETLKGNVKWPIGGGGVVMVTQHGAIEPLKDCIDLLLFLFLFFRKLARTSTPSEMWWTRSETNPPGGVWPSSPTSSTSKNLTLNTSDWVKENKLD